MASNPVKPSLDIPALIPEAEFRHVGRIAPTPAWGMDEHLHTNFNELIVVVQGRLETRIQGQVLHAVPGQVFFYPQGVPHSELAVGPGQFESVFFSWQESPMVERPLQGRDPHGRIQMLAYWMLELSPTENRATKRMLSELFKAVLFEYSRHLEPQESGHLQGAKDFVAAHLADNLSLDDLARAAHISKHHFARRFKTHTGLSPMAYVRHARVEAARTLLLTSSMPLKRIAGEVGLGDEFHLSRVFRKVTGLPPTALRKNR